MAAGATQQAQAQDGKKYKFEAGAFDKPGQAGFFLLPASGGEAKPLGCYPELSSVGSPAYSADGKWIAFDAVPSGGDVSGTQIIVAKADGSEARSLGAGLMPSWSKDGTKIACSRYENGSSVWTFDVETGKAQQVEANAWGIQWSPDGAYQAFSRTNGTLVVRNVKTGQTYEYPYGAESSGGWDYNFGWSPGSLRICGVVRLENQQYSAMIVTLNLPQNRPVRGPTEVRQGEFQLVVASKGEMCRDVAWHPTEQRVVLSLWLDSARKQQLFEFNPDSGTVPFPMASQSATENYDHCWSPDGKQLLYVGRYPQ
jgi:Tol biopolymer transport system component